MLRNLAIRQNKFFVPKIGFVLTLSLAVGIADLGYGQTSEPRKFGQKSGKLTVNAMNDANLGRHDKALKKLEKALKLDGLSPYEISTINRMKGFSQFDLSHYDEAISSYEAAIDAGGLLKTEMSLLEGQIGQLYLTTGQYEKGAKILEAYIESGGKQYDITLERITLGWVYSEDFSRALPWAEKWFDQVSEKKAVNYQVLDFLYTSLGMQAKQSANRERWERASNDQRPVWAHDASAFHGNSNKLIGTRLESRPLVRAYPKVPSGARKSGHCKVNFDINESGFPENVVTSYCTKKIFSEEAIKTVQKWIYTPRLEDGKKTAQIGEESTVRFILRNNKGEIIPE